MRTRTVAVAAVVVFALCAVAGQTVPIGLSASGQIPRDPGGLLPGGTAVLAGTVVSDDAASRPLRGATVAIHGAPFHGDGGRTTVTDEAGRFTFNGLLAGSYMLSTQKPGYITKQYGTARAGRGGNGAIDLTDGQQLTSVTMKLPHGSVIAGTVTDSKGRPVQNVRVSILEYRFANGQRTLVQAATSGGGNGNTDDRGMYRVHGLPAGEYFVEALPPPNFGGNNSDIHPMTAADIQWAQQQVQRNQNNSGATVSPGASASVVAPTPAQAVGYSPIFYPSTADISGATRVALGPGEERTGIDFPLQYVPTAKIEGVVLDPNGQPVRPNSLMIARVGQAVDGASGIFLQQTQQGTFSGAGIPPGDYRITARTMPQAQPQQAPAGRGRGGVRGAGARQGAGPAEPVAPPAAAETLWAASDVTVQGQDVTGITLRLQPGVVATGHLTFDTPNALPGTAASAIAFMRNIHIQLLQMPGAEAAAFPNQGALTARVNEDGSFFVAGILPGASRFATNGPGRGDGTAPGNWILEHVVVNGHDVTDVPFEIRPNDKIDDVAITFFNRPAEISGKVLDPLGRPVADDTVVLFSAQKAFWGLQTRRTAEARSAPTGDFRFASLPPGEYYMSVVPGPDPPNLGDPTFFGELVGASLKITVAEGEKKVQDLKLSGG